MGIFSLYWAGLQLSASLMSLDVYAQTTRLILAAESKRDFHIQRHFGFLAVSTLFLGPLAVSLNMVYGSGLKEALLFIFIVHLVVETFATDMGRLLVPLHKPLLSNFMLFVRSAIWVYPLVFAFEVEALPQTPDVVVFAWLLGSTASLFFGFKGIASFGFSSKVPTLDMRWIKDALVAGALFILATLLFRSMLGLDRFFVNSVFDESSVAIYAVYASVVLSVLALVESGVSAWHYPKMVASIRKQDFLSVKGQMFSFFMLNAAATLVLFLSLFVIFPYLASYMLPKEYLAHYELLFYLSFGVIAYCLSMPFHYFIYGFSKDFYFLFIYSFGFIAMIVWVKYFMMDYGIVGAGVMLSISLSIIAIFRILVSVRIYLDLRSGNHI